MALLRPWTCQPLCICSRNMEWLIGIGVVVLGIVILSFIGRMRVGAGLEELRRQERKIQQTSGTWVEIRVVALTDRGTEAVWKAVGVDEDDAIRRAVQAINLIGTAGRVVRVVGKHIVSRSDGS